MVIPTFSSSGIMAAMIQRDDSNSAQRLTSVGVKPLANTSTKAPLHLPHINHPEVLAVGMRPRRGDWFEPARDPEAIRAHKQARREALGSGVYNVLPNGLDAAKELAKAALAAASQDLEQLADIPENEWLWRASLAVHEDLVVMVPEAGSYSLAAASLCSPSHWRLSDKIGKSMARVHDPIPRIHEGLTPRIDRIFDNLRVDTPVERFNWSLQQDTALFCWPDDHPDTLAADAPLFYRVERQTLTRLPQSGALAFTIRVHIDPLESLLLVPDALPALLAAIDGTRADLAEYKAFAQYEVALDKYRTMADQPALPDVSSSDTTK